MKMATDYMRVESQYKRRQLVKKVCTITGNAIIASAIGTVIAIVIQGAL